jgi:hypothetical protein
MCNFREFFETETGDHVFDFGCEGLVLDEALCVWSRGAHEDKDLERREVDHFGREEDFSELEERDLADLLLVNLQTGVGQVLGNLVEVGLGQPTLGNLKSHVEQPFFEFGINKVLFLNSSHKPVDFLGRQEFALPENSFEVGNRDEALFERVLDFESFLQDLVTLLDFVHVNQFHRFSVNLHVLLLSLSQHFASGEKGFDSVDSNVNEFFPGNHPIVILVGQRYQGVDIV